MISTKTMSQRRNDHRYRVPNNNEGVDCNEKEGQCSSSAGSSTEPDLSEDEAFLSMSAAGGGTTTRPRQREDDDDGHNNKFLVLQQLNVAHLSDRKRRRMVDEIRSIQETVDHPHSTYIVPKNCPKKRILLAARPRKTLTLFFVFTLDPPASPTNPQCV